MRAPFPFQRSRRAADTRLWVQLPSPVCARGRGHWRAGRALSLQGEPEKGGFLPVALVMILRLSQHPTSEKALYLFGSPSAPLWAEGADHWFQAPHQRRHARRIHSSPREDCGPVGSDVRPGVGALDQRAPSPFLLQHCLSLIDYCRHMDGVTYMNLWIRWTLPVGTRCRRGSGQQDGHTFLFLGGISLFWSLGTWAATRVLLCVLRWGLAARG